MEDVYDSSIIFIHFYKHNCFNYIHFSNYLLLPIQHTNMSKKSQLKKELLHAAVTTPL